jgi:hypothetical protein
VLVGILDVKGSESSIFLGQYAKTSDMIADCLHLQQAQVDTVGGVYDYPMRCRKEAAKNPTALPSKSK